MLGIPLPSILLIIDYIFSHPPNFPGNNTAQLDRRQCRRELYTLVKRGEC